MIGALFRRERENPGPLLQVSSDAAEALACCLARPPGLRSSCLRRQEVEVAPAEENPVVASLAAPVAVEAEPLEPAEEGGAGAAAAATAAVVLPAAVEAATSAAEETAAATATAATAVPHQARRSMFLCT